MVLGCDGLEGRHESRVREEGGVVVLVLARFGWLGLLMDERISESGIILLEELFDQGR